MASFGDRLRAAIGPRGYDNSLRRSIQSVALYEAKRILAQIEAQRTAENLASLRAFQRKHVHWETAKALLEATDLQPHQRLEVFWRTGTSKEPLGPETAWKRSKMIDKELKAIAEKIGTIQDGRTLTHDQAIDEFIRQDFIQAQAGRDRSATRSWGYSHNNCLLCYQMYYLNGQIDPALPPARSPRVISIPTERPRPNAAAASLPAEEDVTSAELAAIVSDEQKAGIEERRAVLSEVREHLDLLKDFAELIPPEELNKRKRELFLALPDAPPPAVRKQARLD